MNIRPLMLMLSLFAAIIMGCDDSEPAPTLPEPVAATASADAPRLKEAKLGEISNLHVYDQCYLAGQPSVEDMKVAKEAGVKTIINLMPHEDQDFDEAAAAKELGLHYINLPISGAEDLTDSLLNRARQELTNAPQPLIMHCGSANRVGALWLAKRTLDDGLTTEAALAEADQVGLRNQEMKKRVLEYIEDQRQKSLPFSRDAAGERVFPPAGEGVSPCPPNSPRGLTKSPPFSISWPNAARRCR